jgi:hypothetical protein
MSERLETLNIARARMIEDRDMHAKVLPLLLTGTRRSEYVTNSSRFRHLSTH